MKAIENLPTLSGLLDFGINKDDTSINLHIRELKEAIVLLNLVVETEDLEDETNEMQRKAISSITYVLLDLMKIETENISEYWKK